MQQVYEGITKSGVKGLFTNGMLVMSIKPDGKFSCVDSRNWWELTGEEKHSAMLKRGFDFILPPQ
jgi:hypothetical protein